jgi:hypothetical protein
MITGEFYGVGFGDPVVVNMKASFDAGFATFVLGER